MRVAVFYPSVETAWSITKGVCSTLHKMGHSVTDCGSDFSGRLDHDLIFVSGPEYLWKKLREIHPQWDRLDAVKVGWLHETVEREDYDINPIAVNGKLPMEEIKKFTPQLFTPAIQDQTYDAKFLPFGVDTDMFYPRDKTEYSVIYTGSVYKKRRDFLEKYPSVRTMVGYRPYDETKDYVYGIGRATAVLNLPSLSEASNTRTFETLACKTALITPAMRYPDYLFEDGKHLLYYQGSPEEAVSKMRTEATRLAEQGYDLVTKRHSMLHRMRYILDTINARPLRFRKR